MYGGIKLILIKNPIHVSRFLAFRSYSLSGNVDRDVLRRFISIGFHLTARTYTEMRSLFFMIYYIIFLITLLTDCVGRKASGMHSHVKRGNERKGKIIFN